MFIRLRRLPADEISASEARMLESHCAPLLFSFFENSLNTIFSYLRHLFNLKRHLRRFITSLMISYVYGVEQKKGKLHSFPFFEYDGHAVNLW